MNQESDSGDHQNHYSRKWIKQESNVGAKRSGRNPGKENILDTAALRRQTQQAEEGINLAVEQIEEIKTIPGIKGFHIMAIEWEEKVPVILERVGLHPRPKLNGG